MLALRRVDLAIAITILMATTWILLTSGFTLLSLSKEDDPGTIPLDWHDEIRWMATVLNWLVPAAILLIGAHLAIAVKTKEWKPVLLLFEGCGVGSAIFVAVAVWSFIASVHLPEIHLWENHIWWQ